MRFLVSLSLMLVFNNGSFAEAVQKNLKRKPDSMRIVKYCFSNENSEGFKQSCYSTAKLCEERRVFWLDVDNLNTQECRVVWD